jgi:hypothetical protein
LRCILLLPWRLCLSLLASLHLLCLLACKSGKQWLNSCALLAVCRKTPECLKCLLQQALSC